MSIHIPGADAALLDHDADLATVLRAMERRRALRWLGGAGASAALALAGCGGGDSGSSAFGDSSGSSTGSGSTTTSGSCSLIPEETAGPYPADGSNSNGSGVVNALTLSGIVRSDIRSSVAGASGTAGGIPLTVAISLANTTNACAALEGYAVYLWHCTRDGLYSLYSSGVTNQNYLRGVQATDADGIATFQTIFPGCYSGRMPHIHFEIYRSLSTATASTSKLRTSQMAFPTSVCDEVYATSAYASSATNFARISFSTDNVFSDGVTTQLATVSGNTTDGYVATLHVGIAA